MLADNTGIATLVDQSGNGHDATLNNFALNGPTSNWVAPGGVMTGSACTPLNTFPVMDCAVFKTVDPIDANDDCQASLLDYSSNDISYRSL